MGLPAPGPGHNSSWLWKARLTAIIQFLILFNAVLTCKNKCFITDNEYAASGRVFLSVHRHRKPWPKAVSPLRPRFPGYQSSISWKEIGRWSRSTLASWLCWQIENRRGLGGELVLPAVDHTDQQVRTRPSSHDITLPDRRWF